MSWWFLVLCFFWFFLLLGIISWQMRRRSEALSSAPSELLAAKCCGGDPGLQKKKYNTPKKEKTPSNKALLLLQCEYGVWDSSGGFYVPGGDSLGKLEQEPPVGTGSSGMGRGGCGDAWRGPCRAVSSLGFPTKSSLDWGSGRSPQHLGSCGVLL